MDVGSNKGNRGMGMAMAMGNNNQELFGRGLATGGRLHPQHSDFRYVQSDPETP